VNKIASPIPGRQNTMILLGNVDFMNDNEQTAQQATL